MVGTEERATLRKAREKRRGPLRLPPLLLFLAVEAAAAAELVARERSCDRGETATRARGTDAWALLAGRGGGGGEEQRCGEDG
jgi:hypothetical protein